MAQCTTCREDINEGAKKRIHCNSYQDFRRYINISKENNLVIRPKTSKTFKARVESYRKIDELPSFWENPSCRVEFIYIGFDMKPKREFIDCKNAF